MQIATITGPTYEIIDSRIALANRLGYGVEFRLDLIKEDLDFERLKNLREKCTGQVIFSLRSRREGGGFIGTEEKREKIIMNLLRLEPNFFDLEWSSSQNLFSIISESYPSTKIISSYYDFDRTPKNLDFVLQKMMVQFAHIYKICVTANSLPDAYRMLRFLLKMKATDKEVIGLCMGEYGRITRKEESGNYLRYTLLNQLKYAGAKTTFCLKF